MQTHTITFGGQAVTIAFAAEFTPVIHRLFSTLKRTEIATPPLFTINHHHNSGRFSIRRGNTDILESASAGQCAQLLEKSVLQAFIKSIDTGVALLGGAVAGRPKSMLIPAVSGDGKTLLMAWLLANGYRYLNDRLVVWSDKPKALHTFGGSFKINRRIAPQALSRLGLDDAAPELIHTPDTVLVPPAALPAARPGKTVVPKLIVFADLRANHKFSAAALTPAQAVARLMGCVANSGQMTHRGVPIISALARRVPALEIMFDSIGQLDENMNALLEVVLASDLDPKTWKRFSRAFQIEKTVSSPSTSPQTTAVSHPIPAPTARNQKRKLTIGMATYDDFDGVYFSVQAIRMYHPEVVEQTEILVVDNHPESAGSLPLKKLDRQVAGYRYVPFNRFASTAVRDLIFREASADFVLCMDSHVLLYPGAIKNLIQYYDQNPQTPDLLHGPMLSDSQKTVSTHFEPTWGAGMYGQWGTDIRGEDSNGDPFEIQMQGLGLFTCRKVSWPGFNSRFSGFGGEEGYIHEKFRQQGGKVICLPFLRWLHRFLRPMGVQYPLNWKDRIRNYYIGFTELGMDTSEIEAHFSEHLGKNAFTALKDEITAEIESPFFYFDAIYCINLESDVGRWEKIMRRFERLGIDHRIRRFRAVETPGNHHIGCALSHRSIIAEARWLGLKNVLVFEDDAVFLKDALNLMERTIAELKKKDWTLFYLGGHRWEANHPLAPGCQHLRRPDHRLTCTHALAYHHTIFSKILSDLPDDIPSMQRWLETEHGIDQYLRYIDRRFLAEPVVASQPSILEQEDRKHKSLFTL